MVYENPPLSLMSGAELVVPFVKVNIAQRTSKWVCGGWAAGSERRFAHATCQASEEFNLQQAQTPRSS